MNCNRSTCSAHRFTTASYRLHGVANVALPFRAERAICHSGLFPNGRDWSGGYAPEMAQRVFKQIEGFGSYGFPESHAASFAHLVYASSWLKCHHPAVFACALLNSQPMGFYAPAQIVRDAREHGVEVRPVCVNASEWDCTLEPDPRSADQHAMRLGLRMVSGLREEDGRTLLKARLASSGRRSSPLMRRHGGRV